MNNIHISKRQRYWR